MPGPVFGEHVNDSTETGDDRITTPTEAAAALTTTPQPTETIEATVAAEPTATKGSVTVPDDTPTQVPDPTHIPESEKVVLKRDLESILLAQEDLPEQWIQQDSSQEEANDEVQESEPIPCELDETDSIESVEAEFETDAGFMSTFLLHVVERYAPGEAEHAMIELRESVEYCLEIGGWEEVGDDGHHWQWTMIPGDLPQLGDETVVAYFHAQVDMRPEIDSYFQVDGYIHVIRREDIISMLMIMNPNDVPLLTGRFDFVQTALFLDGRLAEQVDQDGPTFEIGDEYTFSLGSSITLNDVRSIDGSPEVFALEMEACAGETVVPRPSSESVQVLLNTGETIGIVDGADYGLTAPPVTETSPSDVVLWDSCASGEYAIELSSDTSIEGILFDYTAEASGVTLPVTLRWNVAEVALSE